MMMRMLGVFCVLVCFGCSLAAYPLQAVAQSMEDADSLSMQRDVEWLWGEVVNVGAGSVTVRYLDYEDDTEKQMIVSVTDETVFENAVDLSDIDIGDTLSVDYAMTAQGEVVAVQISKEDVADDAETMEGSIADVSLDADDALSDLSDIEVTSVPVE